MLTVAGAKLIFGMRIVILAGGEGRRIGGGKPQRLLGGETLLDRALRRARSWSDEVLVAARHGGDIATTGRSRARWAGSRRRSRWAGTC